MATQYDYSQLADAGQVVEGDRDPLRQSAQHALDTGNYRMATPEEGKVMREIVHSGQPIRADNVLRMPIRTARVELDGDYQGFWAVMRLNPRRSVVQGMTLGEIRALADSLAKVILSWNFPDEDGVPLAITADAIFDLPDDLLGATMTGYFAKFTKDTEVPKEPPTLSTTT